MNTDRALMPDEPVERAPREDLHDPRRGGRELDEANDAHDTLDRYDVHDAQEDPRSVALMAAPLDSSGERVGWAGTALGGAAAALLLVAGAAGGGGAHDVSRGTVNGEGAVPPPPPPPQPQPQTPSPSPSPSPSPDDPSSAWGTPEADGGGDGAASGTDVTGAQSPADEMPSDAVPQIALMSAVPGPDARWVTRDATVLVNGIAPRSTWWYTLDAGLSGEWIQGRGDRVPGSAFGEDGIKHVMVRQINEAGTPGNEVSLKFTLDTTPPQPARPRLSNDTGLPGDRLTRDWSFTVGALESGATWRYRIDETEWVAGTGDRVTAPPSDGALPPLAQGAHAVQVEVRDLAGNSALSSLSFQLDTVGPADTLSFKLANDSGDDRITNDPTLSFGELLADERGSVSVDQGATWHSLLAGESSLPLLQHLMGTDGRWQVLARREDLAGNAGPTGPALAFTLDRTGPEVPAAVRLVHDSGFDASDGITNRASILVTMTSDAVRSGYRLRGAEAWTPVPTGGVIPDAQFSASETPYTVEVAQWDLAGNRGVSAWLSFTKALPPGTPTLTLPGAATFSDGVGLPV